MKPPFPAILCFIFIAGCCLPAFYFWLKVMPSATPNTGSTAAQASQNNANSGQPNPPLVPAITLTLKGGSDEIFQIQQVKPTKKSHFVSIGKSFGFEQGSDRFKITSSSKKIVQHPRLGALDIYVVKIFDSVAGKEFELVQGSETEVQSGR